MPTISELPYLDTTSIYYSSYELRLVADGYSVDSDYVTGQVSIIDVMSAFVDKQINWSPSRLDPDDRFLYGTYYGDDRYALCGASFPDMMSLIISYITDDSQFSDYISSCVGDYLSNNFSDYANSFMEGYIGSVGSVAYTSEITGIAVLDASKQTLRYLPCSSFTQIVNTCIYYGAAYPHSLDDYTPIVGMTSYLSETLLAPITLGAIVSYIKSQL